VCQFTFLLETFLAPKDVWSIPDPRGTDFSAGTDTRIELFQNKIKNSLGISYITEVMFCDLGFGAFVPTVQE
jgi:hypothetical protein